MSYALLFQEEINLYIYLIIKYFIIMSKTITKKSVSGIKIGNKEIKNINSVLKMNWLMVNLLLNLREKLKNY